VCGEMAHIENFPFRPEMKVALLAGRKCTTARSKAYGEPGDTFNIDDEIFRIVDVEPEMLDFITSAYYRLEGCKNPDDFIALWKRLHRGQWNPDKEYFVHFLAHVIDIPFEAPQ